jgi:iron complex outermembrane receptor protein
LRVTVSGQSQDGYYKNIFNGSTLGGGTDFAGRVQLRYTPTPNTTIDITADAVHSNDNILQGGQVSNDPFNTLNLKPFTVDLNQSPNRQRQLYGFAVNVEQKLPAGFTLTSISSYRQVKDDYLNDDGDQSPLDAFNIDFHNTDHDISQELRIASPANPSYDYVVGVFYYHENPRLNEVVSQGPDYPTVAVRGDQIITGGTVHEDQEAIYGHGTLHPFSWLAIDAGVRYQQTTKVAYKVQNSEEAPYGYPGINMQNSLGESSVDPLLSVTVTPIHGINVYALYSTGDRAGGFNVDLLKSVGDYEFKSESVVNYEAGVKSQLFGNRLRLNADVYKEIFHDFQQQQNVIDPNPVAGTIPGNISIYSNAASVHSEGIEADFDAAPLEGLSLTGGVGINHAYFASFPNGAGPGTNLTGNNLIEAPRFQGSFTTEYKHAVTDKFDGTASVTYTYRSHVYSSPYNNGKYVLYPDEYLEQGFASVNSRISLINRSGNFELSLYARNLLNETHIDGAYTSALGYPYKVLSEPRTIGVELTVRN